MEGTRADTDNIGSPMLLKQSILDWLLNSSQWMSASSRVIVLQLLLFLFFVPPQSKISHRSCVQPLFHTFRHSYLLNTSLKGFNLFLFKIMLFLSHQNPCLCQIQLVLSVFNLPASQRHGLQLLLHSGDCTFSPSSVSLGESLSVNAGWSQGSVLGFSLPLSLCFCISYSLMKIFK